MKIYHFQDKISERGCLQKRKVVGEKLMENDVRWKQKEIIDNLPEHAPNLTIPKRA